MPRALVAMALALAVGLALAQQARAYVYATSVAEIVRWNLDASVAPNGIDVDGEHVWWINGATNTVGRANLDGSPEVWDLSLAAAPSAQAVVGEPVHAVAGLGEPADPSVEAGAPPTGCRAAGAIVSPACQGWGDDGLTFQLHGPDDPSCSRRAVFTQSVRIGAAVAGQYATGELVPTRVGSYRWTVALSDIDNEAPPVGCADGPAVEVGKAMPTLSVAASAGVELGGSVDATATLAGGYELGAGEVGFRLHGPDDLTCSAAPVFSSVVAVDGAGAYDAAAFRPQRAGVYRWVVSFAGDERNAAVATACDDTAAAVAVAEPPVPPEPPAPPVEHVPPRADPGPPPAAPESPAPPASQPAPQPAIAQFALADRCVRPAANGRTVVQLRLATARADAVRVTVERALGTRGLDRCPTSSGRRRFAGRYRTVATVRDVRTRAAVAAAEPTARSTPLARRLTLRLRLEPGLYRITVRAHTGGGRLSAPKRRFLRVLAPG